MPGATPFSFRIMDKYRIVNAAKSLNKGKAGSCDGIPDCLFNITGKCCKIRSLCESC
jgi:hypothetical protein